MSSRRLAAALSVLLLIVLLPSRAYAGSPADRWPDVFVCTEVELTGTRVDLNSALHRYGFIGYTRACPGADDPAARWSVAEYRITGPGVVYRPMEYGEPGGRGFRFLYTKRATPDTWAACVVNHVQVSTVDPELATASRVVCIGPDPTRLSTDGVLVSIDDARFDGALLGNPPGGPRPACGSCV